MAHCDYDCCAVCDGKMAYNPFDAQTKTRLCGECVTIVHRVTGAVFTTGDDLASWLATAPIERVAKLRIKPCIYSNAVDHLVQERFDEFQDWLVRTTRRPGLLPDPMALLIPQEQDGPRLGSGDMTHMEKGDTNPKEVATDGN